MMDTMRLRTEIIWYHNRLLQTEEMIDQLLFELGNLDTEAATELAAYLTDEYVRKKSER